MPVWDLAAATYDSVSLSTSGNWCLYWKPDGTKLYTCDHSSRVVKQWSVSTPWDISTASLLGTSYTATTQITNVLNDVDFNDDGTKMYLLDQGAGSPRSVYQYTLGTAWDVSTASYASKSFNFASQSNSPQHLFFKPDGTKMWMTHQAGDAVSGSATIYQYDLSTAWDVSTASYASKSFGYGHAQDNSSFFKSDGTKLYEVDAGSDRIYQWSLSTPWDVTTATVDAAFVGIGALDTAGRDLFIRPDDGTKLWFYGSLNSTIYQYTLGAVSAGVKVRGYVVFQ